MYIFVPETSKVCNKVQLIKYLPTRVPLKVDFVKNSSSVNIFTDRTVMHHTYICHLIYISLAFSKLT